MHLLIPFASPLSEDGAQSLRKLSLPHLQRVLGRLEPTLRLGTDEYSLSTPHECALAATWGWQGGEGQLPFAAREAQQDGIAVADLAWALLTPVHWEVGRDRVKLADPELLALDDAESRTLFDAVRGLFESEGFALAWGAPQRWYAAHESFAKLACASLDRAVGRNVDPWLPGGPQARLLRRLQNEVQMLLHDHPVNRVREAEGRQSVNSLWLSGCGRHQAVGTVDVDVDVEPALRGPLLHEDWPAWSAAWEALDAGPVAALAQRLAQGEAASLTLSGERFAQRFDPPVGPWWRRVGRRWRTPDVSTVLEPL